MKPNEEMSDLHYAARRGVFFVGVDAVGGPLWERFGSIPPWIAVPAIMIAAKLYPSLWLILAVCIYMFAYVHARMRRLAPPSAPTTVQQRIELAKQREMLSRQWEVPPEWDAQPAASDDPSAGPRFGRQTDDP